MAETTRTRREDEALTLGESHALTPYEGPSLPTVRRRAPDRRARVEELRHHLEVSQRRLQFALVRVRESARELTPAARIHQQPMTWVAGAFAVGLALGFMSAASRS